MQTSWTVGGVGTVGDVHRWQENTVARAMRVLRRDRVAGYAVGGVLVALVVATVGWGGPLHSVLPKISDIGGWLANDSKGSVTHVNGLSGKVDSRVPLTNAAGHPLKVVQDGDTVLVQDTVTGVVSRLDTTQLDVAQSARFAPKGVQIVTGAGAAYVIDQTKGLVQALDPDRLAVIGSPVSLKPPLADAAVGAHGTLWVPVESSGQLVPVTGESTGAPVSVGSPGDTLRLTMAGAVPVVTDETNSTVTVAQDSGSRQTVNLPAPGGVGAATLLTPSSTDGALVPLLAPAARQMVLVDTRTGAPTSVSLDGLADHDLGVPQTLGTRVYIPDNTTGRLIVYDAGAGEMLNQITVTGKRTKLDLFPHDGMLWANDAQGATAVSVDESGAVHSISKYTADVPGGPLPVMSRTPQTPQPRVVGGNPPAGGARLPRSTTGSRGGRSEPPAPKASSRRPSPSASKASALPPGAPTNVRETSQRGAILVQFNPSAGATPTGYSLTGTPAGASVTQSGQYAFTVSKLECGPTYTFSVVAHYRSGDLPAKGAGALACLAPKAPARVSLNTGSQHQITASWPATTDNGGGSVTYRAAITGGKTVDVGTKTSQTFTGLTNFKSYTVTVTAANGAGRSTPPAEKAATLSAGPWSGTVNNMQYTLSEQASKNVLGNRVHTFPPGSRAQVTVECIDNGAYWKDPNNSPSGTTWYRVTKPVAGWIGSGYVDVSGVWQCDGQFG